MNRRSERKLLFLLCSYLLIVFGYIFSSGFYFIPGLIFLSFSFLLLLIFHNSRIESIVKSPQTKTFTSLLLILFVALSMGLYGGLYQNNLRGFVSLSRILLAVALMISILYLIDFSKWLSLFSKFKFWLLLFIALSLRVLMIWSSPSPHIDVFTIQKIAPKAIISGDNPYSIIYPQLYPNERSDVYTYGPGTILFNTPAVLATGDPRYTMVFSEIGTALLMYFILKKAAAGKTQISQEIKEIIPLIFLFNPRFSFIIEQAWIDPLVIFLLTLFVYYLFILRKKYLAFIILGVILATKQYSIFLIPFLVNGGYLRVRNLLVSLGVFLILTIPFYIWNSQDFLHDFVFYALVYPPRYDSLSFNSLVNQLTGFDIPTPLIIISEVFVLTYLLKFQKKFVLSATFLATSTFILFTFLLYKLAFIHYYYFASNLLLISIVLMYVESSKDSVNPRRSISK